MNVVRKIVAFLGFAISGFLLAIVVYFIFKFGVSQGWAVNIVTFSVATITVFSLLLIVIGLPIPIYIVGSFLIWRNARSGKVLIIFASVYLLFWSFVVFVLLLANLLTLQEGSEDVFNGTVPSLAIFSCVQLLIIILSLVAFVIKQKKETASGGLPPGVP
jgi:predicted secreted protein